MLDINESIIAANKILVAVENTFNTNSVDLPGRRYTTAGGIGTVAYDCEQLTVSWQETYLGSPGQPQFGIQNPNCNTLHTGVFIVELVRSIPISFNAEIPPEPELIQKAADKLMKDATLLQEAGQIAAEDSLLSGALISVRAGDPAGAMQSIVMTVTMVI